MDGFLRLAPVGHRHPDRFAILLDALGRHPRDQGGEAGDRSVGTPEFLAVDDEGITRLVQDRLRLDVRRIRAGDRLSQREGGELLLYVLANTLLKATGEEDIVALAEYLAGLRLSQ